MRECGVTHVNERELASESLLRQWCERVCGAGYRGTGTAQHDALIDWVVERVREIPGFAVRTDEYELLGWHPVPEGDLERAGTLALRLGRDRRGGSGPVLVPHDKRRPHGLRPARRAHV